MSDLFLNKVAAALLASALGVILINKFAGAVVHPETPDASEFAYSLATLDTGPVEAIEIPFPSADWIAARDAEKGAKVFRKCTSCHNADAGGANGTGPNLYGVVGAQKATHAGFKYSAAMQNSGGAWTYESLDQYLEKPAAYVPKTNMAFIGLKKEADRAAVIEYLRLAADTPMAPLTEAAPIPGADVVETHAEAGHDETKTIIEHAEDGAKDMMEKAEDGATTIIEKIEDGAEAVVEKADEGVKEIKDAVKDMTDDHKDEGEH